MVTITAWTFINIFAIGWCGMGALQSLMALVFTQDLSSARQYLLHLVLNLLLVVLNVIVVVLIGIQR